MLLLLKAFPFSEVISISDVGHTQLRGLYSIWTQLYFLLRTKSQRYAGLFISWGLKGSRMYHPKICHFGIRTAFCLKQLRRSRYKEVFFCPPFYVKGHKFINVSPLFSLPAREKANYWRQL